MIIFWSLLVVVWGICIYINETAPDYRHASISEMFVILTLISIVYILAVGCIFMAVLTQSETVLPKEYQYGWSNEIVAMKDGNSYIVSRHHVSESDKYYFMVKYDGYYKSYSYPQYNSSIFEVDSGKYELKNYVENPVPKNFIQKDLAIFYNFVIGDSGRNYKYEFYIPNGSIVQDFKIDLQN